MPAFYSLSVGIGEHYERAAEILSHFIMQCHNAFDLLKTSPFFRLSSLHFLPIFTTIYAILNVPKTIPLRSMACRRRVEEPPLCDHVLFSSRSSYRKTHTNSRMNSLSIYLCKTHSILFTSPACSKLATTTTTICVKFCGWLEFRKLFSSLSYFPAHSH